MAHTKGERNPAVSEPLRMIIPGKVEENIAIQKHML